jgi:hypothetical protein
MEDRTGIEPVKNGVADRRIATLPPIHKKTSVAFANRGSFRNFWKAKAPSLIISDAHTKSYRSNCNNNY